MCISFKYEFSKAFRVDSGLPIPVPPEGDIEAMEAMEMVISFEHTFEESRDVKSPPHLIRPSEKRLLEDVHSFIEHNEHLNTTYVNTT